MLPHVIMHVGASVDGRIDWGLSPQSPYYEVMRSFQADIDLTGSNTMLAAPASEDPQTEYGEVYEEWIRQPGRPKLAVVDSRGRIRNWGTLQKQAWWSGLIALCSEATPKEHLRFLADLGIETIVAGQEKVNLRRALEELNSRFGTRIVRTDCGGTLNGVLLRDGLVSEVSVIIHPSLVGGTSARSMFAAPDLSSEEGVVRLRLKNVERMDEEFVWLRYEVCEQGISRIPGSGGPG